MGVVLRGGTVVDLLPVSVAVRDVVMDGNVVVDRPATDADTLVDCSGCVVWPGLVCAHTHLYSGLARGMPLPTGPTASFVQILEQVWWKLDVALDEQTLRASVWAAGLEALKAGTTVLFDHHESPRFIDGSLDVIAEVLDVLGLRAVLCYGASDRHGEDAGLAGVRESERFAARAPQLNGMRGMVGLHAPFTVGAGTLAAAADAARQGKTGIHVHVAEARSDEDDSMARFGVPAVKRLADAGALGPLSLVAHAIHVNADEVDLLASSNTPVVHNVRSNLNNAVGYQHPNRFKMVTLGTDGMDGDMVTETRAVFHNGRAAYGPTAQVDALALLSHNFELAQRHLGGRCGALVPGAAADAVVTSYQPPTPLNDNTVFGHLVFGPSPWPVRDVVASGNLVIRNGVHTQVDEVDVYRRCRAAAETLWKRL